MNSLTLTALNPTTTNIVLPKIGTLIPNRIFVGGITSTTTEDELHTFFDRFGPIKDVKVIYDKSGLSKGNYGFVTFEHQETAEMIIKNEADSLTFKDRKINIGYAVRKQHIIPRQDPNGHLIFSNTAIPCTLQNGISFVPINNHEYPILSTNSSIYPSAIFLPQSPTSNAMFTQGIPIPNVSNKTIGTRTISSNAVGIDNRVGNQAPMENVSNAQFGTMVQGGSIIPPGSLLYTHSAVVIANGNGSQSVELVAPKNPMFFNTNMQTHTSQHEPVPVSFVSDLNTTAHNNNINLRSENRMFNQNCQPIQIINSIFQSPSSTVWNSTGSLDYCRLLSPEQRPKNDKIDNNIHLCAPILTSSDKSNHVGLTNGYPLIVQSGLSFQDSYTKFLPQSNKCENSQLNCLPRLNEDKSQQFECDPDYTKVFGENLNHQYVQSKIQQNTIDQHIIKREGVSDTTVTIGDKLENICQTLTTKQSVPICRLCPASSWHDKVILSSLEHAVEDACDWRNHREHKKEDINCIQSQKSDFDEVLKFESAPCWAYNYATQRMIGEQNMLKNQKSSLETQENALHFRASLNQQTNQNLYSHVLEENVNLSDEALHLTRFQDTSKSEKPSNYCDASSWPSTVEFVNKDLEIFSKFCYPKNNDLYRNLTSKNLSIGGIYNRNQTDSAQSPLIFTPLNDDKRNYLNESGCSSPNNGATPSGDAAHRNS